MVLEIIKRMDERQEHLIRQNDAIVEFIKSQGWTGTIQDT